MGLRLYTYSSGSGPLVQFYSGPGGTSCESSRERVCRARTRLSAALQVQRLTEAPRIGLWTLPATVLSWIDSSMKSLTLILFLFLFLFTHTACGGASVPIRTTHVDLISC